MKQTPFKVVEYTLLTFSFILVAFFIFSYQTNPYIIPSKVATSTFKGVLSPASYGSRFTFTFAGDYGTTPNTDAVFALIKKIQPDFHIAVGDLVYRNDSPDKKDNITVKEWCAYAKKSFGDIPLEIVSGNHDNDLNYGFSIEKLAECLPNMLPKETYFKGIYGKEYYFDYPPVNPIARFIMISPDITFNDGTKYEYIKGTDRYNWLKERFITPKDKGYPWTVVVMHKVCLSTTDKKCEIGKDLMDLIIENKVDLVISGHAHSYQRSYPLTCADDKNVRSECIVKKDYLGDNENPVDVFKRKSGTIFLINGTGGNSLVDVDPNSSAAPYFSIISGKNKNPMFGVVEIGVTANALTGYYIKTDGSVADTFSIVR